MSLVDLAVKPLPCMPCTLLAVGAVRRDQIVVLPACAMVLLHACRRKVLCALG